MENKNTGSEYTLSTEQFEGEAGYQASISIAKSMLKNGIISDSDFSKFDTILRAEYKPFLSDLLAG